MLQTSRPLADVCVPNVMLSPRREIGNACPIPLVLFHTTKRAAVLPSVLGTEGNALPGRTMFH